MSTSIANIAKKVFDALSSELDGVIQSGALGLDVPGEFDPEIADYSDAGGDSYPCRFIVDSTSMDRGKVGTYLIQPNELVLMVIELEAPPVVGATFTYKQAPNDQPLMDSTPGLWDDGVGDVDDINIKSSITHVESALGTGELYRLVVK